MNEYTPPPGPNPAETWRVQSQDRRHTRSMVPRLRRLVRMHYHEYTPYPILVNLSTLFPSQHAELAKERFQAVSHRESIQMLRWVRFSSSSTVTAQDRTRCRRHKPQRRPCYFVVPSLGTLHQPLSFENYAPFFNRQLQESYSNASIPIGRPRAVSSDACRRTH